MEIENTISLKSARHYENLAAQQNPESTLRKFYWNLSRLIEYSAYMPARERKDIKSLKYFAWLDTDKED